MFNTKHGLGRFSRLGLIVVASAALALPASLSALGKSGNYGRTLGNSKFGAYVNLNYGFDIAKESVKSKVYFKPTAGAKIMGRTLQVVGADFIIGNYGSWSMKQVKPDLNKAQEWSAYAGFHIVGITIYSRHKNVGKHCELEDPKISKEAAPKCKQKPKSKDQAKKESKFDKARKWLKKRLPNVKYYIGPIAIYVSSGVTLDTGVNPVFTPDFEIDWRNFRLNKLGVTAGIKPSLAARVFVEGGVSIVVIRGGIGANLTLFSGELGLLGSAGYLKNSNSITANVRSTVGIGVLSGKVYAFVDTRRFKWCCRFRWGRWITHTLASWRGYRWNWGWTLWSQTWRL